MTDTPKTDRMFTTHSVPLRYLVIPKCGCTFVKNLLWRLEHGDAHANQIRIHDSDEQFLRASALGLGLSDIREEHHAFTVIRNPVDRFYSLYTDKVIGKGHQKFVPLRQVLAEKYGLNVQAETAEQHRANCDILIDWLARNLEDGTDMGQDPHWTPQAYRWNLMQTMDLKLLMISDLNAQLSVLARDMVPQIDILLAELEPNRSKKPVTRGDVIDPDLRRKINKVYSNDRRLFQKLRDTWKGLDMTKITNRDVPRLSDVFGNR